MKRIYFLLAALTVVIATMAQNPGILLSYNKGTELKFFRSNQLKEAIDAAKVNDTLYFSSGSFDFSQLPEINNESNAREWSKPLVIIGAGAQDEGGTSVSMPGPLYLKFDESIPFDQRNMSFEGINISNSVSPAVEINELSFINFRGNFYDRNNLLSNPDPEDETWQKPHTYIREVNIDRCYMSNINLEERNVDIIFVDNSKVGNINGACSNREQAQLFSLNHCRIGEVSGSFVGQIINSLVKYDYSSGTNSKITNSALYYSDGNSDMTNCVRTEHFNWYEDNMPNVYDGASATLDDGTSMGLTEKYTLFPSYPTLDTKNSKIDITPDNEVIIKVSVLNE